MENGEHVRLLGINTPERGERYYDKAKNFLENEILNKSVKLEYGKEKKDLYNRTLAYVFLDSENVNLKLVEEGFANFYFPSGKDVYYDNFYESWEKCIESNKNLCGKSTNFCGSCIGLTNLDYETQELVLQNRCDVSCDLTSWEIKDEGRKKFIFPNFSLNPNSEVSVIVGNETNTNEKLFWDRKDYVWTKAGDTLFLRDKEGKLVLWYSY